MNVKVHWIARLVAILASVCLSISTALALPRSPFGVKVKLMPDTTNPVMLVDFVVPHGCVLYFERLHFQNSDGEDLTPSKISEPVLEMDKVTGKEKKVYKQSFHAELPWSALPNLELVIRFQGCSNATCFFPEKRTFKLSANAKPGTIFIENQPKPVTPIPSDAGSPSKRLWLLTTLLVVGLAFCFAIGRLAIAGGLWGSNKSGSGGITGPDAGKPMPVKPGASQNIPAAKNLPPSNKTHSMPED